MKSSRYYFLMKTKILADFQICISVPFSSNVFITCMHMTRIAQAFFLIQFWDLPNWYLNACVYVFTCTHTNLWYTCSLFLLFLRVFGILGFTYFYIRPLLQEPLILLFIVAHLSLIFYFIEINQYVFTCAVAVILSM